MTSETASPFEILADKEDQEFEAKILDVLTDRERKVIFARFGLGGGGGATL